MNATLRPLAVTVGEPAGIGPDLCVALAAKSRAWPLLALGDADVLRERAAQLGQALQIRAWHGGPVSTAGGELSLLPIPVAKPVTAGKLDNGNAAHVLEMLRRAANGCLNDEFAGIVTAPVHKAVINDAGLPFTGHTEFFAELSQASPVMMLVSGSLRVALVTTHLPLREVPDAISAPLLSKVLNILHADLQQKFRITAPRILVCGLNPHAGEGGHLGDEEIRIIEPALAAARARGINAIGPLPADTAFTKRQLAGADAVLAMYHDQGLPVLKAQGFGEAVNVTLGLPIIRTSVDHGTALDLAGTGRAESGSLLAAVKLAAELAYA